MKAMIVPGNGNSDITSNWFQAVKQDLQDMGVEVIAQNMPDPDLARQEYWIPFIAAKLDSPESIVIGHSTGAVAALRYAEKHRAKLLILVGAYYTHLDDESEKRSGYFDAPWDWLAIKGNVDRVVIIASVNDPYIPIDQPRYIAGQLCAEYHEYLDEGHFGSDVGKTCFPEIAIFVSNYLSKVL